MNTNIIKSEKFSAILIITILIALYVFFGYFFVFNQSRNSVDSNELDDYIEEVYYDEGNYYSNKYVDATQYSLESSESKIIKCQNNCVIYPLNDGLVDISNMDAKKRRVNIIYGEMIAGDNSIYNVKNASDHEITLLVIKSLISPLNSDPPGPKAYDIETNDHYKYNNNEYIRHLLSNEFFEAIQFEIHPNSKIHSQHYLSGIYYSFNRFGEFEYVTNEEASTTRKPLLTRIWWADSATYSINNNSNFTGKLLFIGIKPTARYTPYEP